MLIKKATNIIIKQQRLKLINSTIKYIFNANYINKILIDNFNL